MEWKRVKGIKRERREVLRKKQQQTFLFVCDGPENWSRRKNEIERSTAPRKAVSRPRVRRRWDQTGRRGGEVDCKKMRG